MLKRVMEWLKGGTHVTDACIDMSTVTGVIPASGRWPEEPYRFQVWVYRVTTTRDAAWVRPEVVYRYEVVPMTEHKLPVDCRGRSIYVIEKAGAWIVNEPVLTVSAAAKAYVGYILSIRSVFEAKKENVV